MKVTVRVKANAREELVTRDGNNMVVHVKEAPSENKANAAVIKALAKYYKVPQASIRIVHGAGSKNKLIEIMGQ